MNDAPSAKVGAFASIVTAICYLLIIILYFILPPEQSSPDDARLFLVSLSHNSQLYILLCVLLVAAGIFGIGTATAVTGTLFPANALVRWISVLAILGFAVLAVDNAVNAVEDPYLAAQYTCGQCQQADVQIRIVAIESIGFTDLNPFGFFGFGLVALWTLVLSGLNLQLGMMPRVWSVLGFGAALAGFLLVIANFLSAGILLAGAIILAVLTLPAWLAWMGLVLWRGKVMQSASGGD